MKWDVTDLKKSEKHKKMSFRITVSEEDPNRVMMFYEISETMKRVVTWFSAMLTIASHTVFLRHFKGKQEKVGCISMTSEENKV